jgi:hypothetical protein
VDLVGLAYHFVSDAIFYDTIFGLLAVLAIIHTICIGRGGPYHFSRHCDISGLWTRLAIPSGHCAIVRSVHVWLQIFTISIL